MSMLASSAIYLLYGLSRQKQWESTRKFVQWLDADSRPTGNWHWAGLAAFQYFINGPFNRARPDDLFEVGIPVVLVMGVAGWVLSKILPSSNAIDAFQQEVAGEADKIRAVAAELERRQAASPAPPAPRPAPAPGPTIQAPAPPVHASGHYYRYQPLDPSLRRKVPVQARLMQFAAGAALAVPIVLSLTAVLLLAGRPLFEAADPTQNVALIAGTPGTEVSPGLLGLFVLTAISATWTLLALGKATEGRSMQTGSRRLSQLAGGLIVGVIAGWAADLLMVSHSAVVSGAGEYFRLEPDQTAAVFVSIGEQPLLNSSGVPSLAGYLIFFGALFALRRWWWHSDSYRSKRFRISSVLLTVAAAWLISSLWAFPQLWAVTWAAVISSSVQLAAAWTPPHQRHMAKEV